MRREDLPKVVCQFCGRKLPELEDYGQTQECVCGAKYEVGLYCDDPSFMFEGRQVEVRVIEKFDTITDLEGQDPATGEWMELVFARPLRPPSRGYDYKVLAAAEQGLEKPCQKISFTVRLAQGETVTKGRLEALLATVLDPLFPESEGWDKSETLAILAEGWAQRPDPTGPGALVTEITVTLGRSSRPPAYSFGEMRLWGERALRFLQRFSKLVELQ